MKMLVSNFLSTSGVLRGLVVALFCCTALPIAFAKQHYNHQGDGLRGAYDVAELKFLKDFARFPLPKFVPTTRVIWRTTTRNVYTTTTKVLVHSAVTINGLLRRNEELDNFNEEVRSVRENPNRWLRKVVGNHKPMPRAQHEPAPKTKPNEHRLHTGIKHATSRRSRYL